MSRTALLEKIERREAVVSVIGLGYVGLPLAVEFAKEGYCVIGIDVSSEKIRLLNEGISYIPDVTTDDVADLVKRTAPGDDGLQRLRRCDQYLCPDTATQDQRPGHELHHCVRRANRQVSASRHVDCP
jgi:UDP-N-acetyl-D-mannosaminuronate dehydrogenase